MSQCSGLQSKQFSFYLYISTQKSVTTFSGVVDCVVCYVVLVVRYGIPVMQDWVLVACDILNTQT